MVRICDCFCILLHILQGNEAYLFLLVFGMTIHVRHPRALDLTFGIGSLFRADVVIHTVS
jgi:hypothetical protein